MGLIISKVTKMQRKELIDLLVSKSLKVAEEPVFNLASGIQSKVYIDCKKTTQSAHGMVLIGNLIFNKISDLDVDAIGGLTLGADPIANAVSYTSRIKEHNIDTFVVRKTAKEHGLKKTVEGGVEKGSKVVIVDDVVTTGQSTIEAIKKAKKFGLEIVKVIVLVDRQEEGGKENIQKQGIDFESIVTKEELLDAYYERANKEGTTPRESARNDALLQS